jgi:hypothetical protein
VAHVMPQHTGSVHVPAVGLQPYDVAY